MDLDAYCANGWWSLPPNTGKVLLESRLGHSPAVASVGAVLPHVVTGAVPAISGGSSLESMRTDRIVDLGGLVVDHGEASDIIVTGVCTRP